MSFSPRSFRSVLVTLGLSAMACSSSTVTESDLEGVPEVSAVQMPLTGSATADGAATETDAIDPTTLVADELEQADVPESTDAADLKQIRGEVKELNASVRTFLSHVAAMVRSTEPTYDRGRLKMWGPVVRGTTEYRFLLRNIAGHHWGWRLDGRVENSGDAYERVAAGEITVGARARRGTGVMGFDLDTLSAVDPTVNASGQILIGFKHGERGTSVGYAVRNFSPDPTTKEPVDALMRAVHLTSGYNRLRLAYHGNVQGTATDAQELVLARVRHERGEGGRSDLVVVSGDVPTGEAWVISQCWDSELKSGFREVRTCPLDGLGGDSCQVTETTGSRTACAALLREPELPPADPSAPMDDASDPNSDVAAPSDIPVVEGDAGT